MISQEVGKPINEARGEFDFGNSWFRYYAEFDRRIDGEILTPDKPNEQLWIVPSPVGVVTGIIPWNFPFAVAVRKIAPALITGNALVLKPHEDTPLSALEIARLAEAAGVPPGPYFARPPGRAPARGGGGGGGGAPLACGRSQVTSPVLRLW